MKRVLFRLVLSVTAVVGFWLLLWAPIAAGGDGDRLPERSLGNPSAPVTIVEYASFSCPACAAFHEDVLPTLTERYIATGKVRLVYRDFPLDASALAASVVARCAPEEHYFRYVAGLYATQPAWSRAQGDARAELAQLGLVRAWEAEDFPDDVARAFLTASAQVAALVGEARQSGLRPAETAACLSDPAMIEQILFEQWEAQVNHGVRGTPSFLIGGEIHAGVLPIEHLQALIEPLLDGS